MEGPELEISELDQLERIAGDARIRERRLAFSLLKDITDNFSEERKIGRGGYGTVYLAVLPSGLRIAVKKFDHMPGLDGSQFENEVLSLMRADHKNIVRYIGYCNHTGKTVIPFDGKLVLAEISEKLICMEYVPGGSLDNFTSNFLTGLGWNERYQILKGICHGLQYLHGELHIFHGDIKPENILLDEHLVPKITDFGLSKSFDAAASSGFSNSIRGTRGYMAPEVIHDGRWSIKSDIFSFGVTILNLFVGEEDIFVVRELSVEQVLEKLRKGLVVEGVFSSWQNKYEQVRTCLEIVYNCVYADPDKRPTALEIIQLLDETESTNDSGSSGHAPLLWPSGVEESDSSDTDTIEPEPTAEFPPSDEKLADLDTSGETGTQDHDKPDLVTDLPVSADLSDLKVLQKITDDFSHERIIGKDGTFEGSHKAFVYKGDIPYQTMVAVKRLIGVEIPVEKFKREAEQFMTLDHKNIAKVAGYCQDESNRHRLVRFKDKQLPQAFDGPEQLLCYEYMHKGSLRDYLIGRGSSEIDWHMRYKLIKGTCEGLHYLHTGRGNCQIVHLNLSPSNVLLDENYTPHITGFDFSKLIGEKNTKSVVVSINGPISYLPPDFFHSRGTDLKYLATVDIYSLGLMILEIATRQEIKGNHGILIKSMEENWREESQIARLYTSLEADKLWQVKLCIDIGLDCVKSKPERRPTARDIIIWLQKGKKSVPVPVPIPRPRVHRPPVHANITHEDHMQEKE